MGLQAAGQVPSSAHFDLSKEGAGRQRSLWGLYPSSPSLLDALCTAVAHNGCKSSPAELSSAETEVRPAALSLPLTNQPLQEGSVISYPGACFAQIFFLAMNILCSPTQERLTCPYRE